MAREHGAALRTHSHAELTVKARPGHDPTTEVMDVVENIIIPAQSAETDPNLMSAAARKAHMADDKTRKEKLLKNVSAKRNMLGEGFTGWVLASVDDPSTTTSLEVVKDVFDFATSNNFSTEEANMVHLHAVLSLPLPGITEHDKHGHAGCATVQQ